MEPKPPSPEPTIDAPVTEEWCARFPLTAAYLINTLARKVDAAAPSPEMAPAQPASDAVSVHSLQSPRESLPLANCVRFLRDLLMEAHNQFDLISIDLDGERISILEAVERADSLLGDHP